MLTAVNSAIMIKQLREHMPKTRPQRAQTTGQGAASKTQNQLANGKNS
jgi:hypothetical protein